MLPVVLDHSEAEILAGGLVELSSEKQKEEETQDKVNLQADLSDPFPSRRSHLLNSRDSVIV